MSDVEFDADMNSRPRQYSGGPGYPFQQNNEDKGITGWLIKMGLAKNARMATIICAIIILVNFAVMFWSWKSGQSPAPRTDVRAEDEMPGHYINSYHPGR